MTASIEIHARAVRDKSICQLCLFHRLLQQGQEGRARNIDTLSLNDLGLARRRGGGGGATPSSKSTGAWVDGGVSVYVLLWRL